MHPTWPEVVLAGLNVLQTVLLAFLAMYSRRLGIHVAQVHELVPGRPDAPWFE